MTFPTDDGHRARLASLERLQRLRADGALSDAEFEEQKGLVLQSGRPQERSSSDHGSSSHETPVWARPRKSATKWPLVAGLTTLALVAALVGVAASRRSALEQATPPTADPGEIAESSRAVEPVLAQAGPAAAPPASAASTPRFNGAAFATALTSFKRASVAEQDREYLELTLQAGESAEESYKHSVSGSEESRFDLDGDKDEDVVSLVSVCEETNCHQTTHSTSVAIFRNLGDRFEVAAQRTYPGDATLKSRSASGVVIETLEIGPDDPHCCPSLRRTHSVDAEG